MEMREADNSFIFEVTLDQHVFTLEVPKGCSWAQAKVATCTFYEEIVRQEYRALLAEATKNKEAADAAVDVVVDDAPAEEVVAEVVN